MGLTPHRGFESLSLRQANESGGQAQRTSGAKCPGFEPSIRQCPGSTTRRQPSGASEASPKGGGAAAAIPLSHKCSFPADRSGARRVAFAPQCPRRLEKLYVLGEPEQPHASSRSAGGVPQAPLPRRVRPRWRRSSRSSRSGGRRRRDPRPVRPRRTAPCSRRSSWSPS